MRIGLVSPYALDEAGGVQAQVVGLAANLAGRGHEPVVIGPRRVLRVRANGSVVPMGVGGVGDALEDLDVVHVHEPAMPFALGAVRGDISTVVTFHADPPGWGVQVIRATGAAIRRKLGRHVATAVSPIAAAPWRAAGLDPVIVPNGVDAPTSGTEVDRHPHRVVFVGRDEPRKGLARLLDAWPAVRAALPDAELVVVGADAAGAGVVGLGRVDDAAKWRALASSAVACAPNTGGESFGIVLVEAMASGCALVCSDLPAFRETAGEAARYVDADEPLAGALVEVLSDSDHRQGLAARGRARAERYRWDTVTDQYLALYVRAFD